MPSGRSYIAAAETCHIRTRRSDDVDRASETHATFRFTASRGTPMSQPLVSTTSETCPFRQAADPATDNS
jgi:hypothetical protein